MSEPKTRKEMLLDESMIQTPDMGEYLDSSMIMKAAEEMANGELGGEFFIEKPFATAPGFYPTENVIIISGKPTFITDKYEKANSGFNRTDGDTIYLTLDEIIDGGDEVLLNNMDKPKRLKDILRQYSESIENSDDLGVRLIGIDAPELPHYREFNYPDKTFKLVTTTYRDLVNAKFGEDYVETSIGAIKKSKFAYVKYNINTLDPTPRNPDEVLSFIQTYRESKDAEGQEDVYFEVLSERNSSKLKICNSHSVDDDTSMDYFKQALGAQKLLKELIKNADNVIYMLDQTFFTNKAKGLIPYRYKKEYEKISESPFYAFESFFKNMFEEGSNAYQQLGNRAFGQELNGRYLGACYVEMNTEYGKQWVNVAKRLISEFPLIKVLPSFSNSGAVDAEFGGMSDIFKIWTYDKSKQEYLDKINNISIDDRYEIQKRLTGVDLSELTNHTVMIGDCLFMVPPTSIRTVTQTRSERISMLRAKGSITKTLPKTERIIELQLFFNGEDSINGIEMEQTTPNGTSLIYHMNGLRSLIAQYKFTPFLPIHNDYINYVLNIEAVSLVSIQVSTVPNYPKTLQATIKMQEFDYRQYMPEILPPDTENKEDLFTNLFSKVIHWPVFRYYYQKSIVAGEQISDLEFDTEPYTEATVGQKTALQNMKFMSPTFELYVANEEMLKQRKSLKQSLEKNPIESIIKFNNKEEAFLKSLVNVYEEVRKAMANSHNLISQMFKVNGNEKVIYTKHSSIDKIIYQDTMDNLIASDRNVPLTIQHGIKVKNKNESDTGFEGKGEYHYEITKTSKEIYDKYMSQINKSMIAAVYKANIDTKMLKNARFAYKQDGNENDWSSDDSFETKYMFGVELDIDWNMLGYKETLDKVRRLIAKNNSVLLEDVFKDGKVFIGWASMFRKDMDTNYNLLLINGPSVNKDTDYNTMAYLTNSFGGSITDDDLSSENSNDEMWNGGDEVGDMKDNIDLETFKSIKYDFYDIGTPIINNISFAYNNVFSNMSMKIYDGYASQYTGGSDTAIEINMTATDEYTVNKLQAISRICAQRLIDFRKILASSPLRINSEMTRFMGVNEVIIESVDISTIPNYPGTWNVSMNLISVDRTLRNREAMKKIDKIKNTQTNMDSMVKTKNYFDVKNALAKVELYPDLELPTIQELEKLGFFFIKYKSEGMRVFPDADFYFSYLHVFSSEMLRETIVNFFKDQNNATRYHKYEGDLFDNDKALVRWSLDKKAKKEESQYKDLKESVDVVSSADFNIQKDQDNMYNVALMTNDAKQVYENMQYIANATKDKKPEELTEIKRKTDELTKKTMEVKNSILTLREALDVTNFDTFDFNSINKVGIKSNVPFSQEKALLTDKKKMKKYIGNNEFKEVESNDQVGVYTESLKAMILDILKKPIKTEKLVFASFDTSFIDFISYLYIDVLGQTSIGQSVSLDSLKMFTMQDQLKNIISACARGATAKVGIFDVDPSLLSGEKRNEDAMPLGYIEKMVLENGKSVKKQIPYILTPLSGQGLSTFTLAETDEERVNGVVFGEFGIKKYSPSMLSNIYGITLINAKSGFIDPYYNADLSRAILNVEITKEEEERRIKEYVENMFKFKGKDNKEESTYASHAFFRNMLVWFYKFLSDERKSMLPDSFFLIGNMDHFLTRAKEADDNFIQNSWQWIKNKALGGSIGKLSKKEKTSAFSDAQREKLAEQRKQKQTMDEETEAEKELEKMIKDIEKELPRLRLSLINGLFLSLGAVALNEFNTPIYSAIKSGDLGTYSNYVEMIKGTSSSGQELSDTDLQMRKMFQYIDFQFDSMYVYNKISIPSEIDKYSFQGKTHRLYLDAAETPSIYLMHSFYDMVMNDCRGRMARAFPTYYMLLIDEGRDLGVWRLQDNFYDVSSITEFQVVRSRKIAADTAKIVMTNLFGTFTTEDDDMKDEYQYTFKDMWNSIFSPRLYADKEYQRYNEARDINRAKLKPGARVSLRMGYSSDASKLPIMFNGSVAEIQEGDLMTVVCQGDGIELANPSMFLASDAKDVADIQYNDSLISGFLGVFEDTTTPRDILLNPLIAEGTWIHEVIKNWSKGRLFNANPFGISHFGDKHFKEIFAKNGEVEQNIYEALSRPTWGADMSVDTNDYSYALTSAPRIKVGLQGNRSYWDLMHIAASVSPDFICSIVPFQMRSSIFYGAPRYYYAYDYDRLPNGQIVEKRKPFQQYHVYTSYTDILNNGITASDKEVRTCAVGVYEKPGVFTGKKSGSVGPLYLDIDIYPEKQKMTTINCNFEYVNFDLIPFTIPVIDAAMNEVAESGGYQIAWRATANGLRETVKDMYTGELIVVGDPTVKPYDKLFINDLYEDMQGTVDVETVVHTFSVDTGFTTSITPDCVVAIDNKYEQICNNLVKEMLLPCLATHTTLVISSLLFANIARSMFFGIDKALKLGADVGSFAANNVTTVLGKENLAQFSQYTDKLADKLGYGFGVTPADSAIYRSVNSLENAYKSLNVTKKITSSKDLGKIIDDILNLDDTLKALDPDSLLKLLQDVGNDNPKVVQARKDAIKLKGEYNKAYASAMQNINVSSNEIEEILNIAKKNIGEANMTDDIKKAMDLLTDSKGIKYVNSIDDVSDQLKALKLVSSHIDDVTEGSKALSIFTRLNDDILKGAKTAFKSFDNVQDTFKAVNAIRKGTIGIKAALSTNLLWLAAEIVLTKSVTEFLERKMKNWQVLTVFPIMKNGRVLTAGLDGNKGSVFGSPTYNQAGWLEQQAINFFEYKGNALLTILRDMFITTDEMLKTIDGYKRDNGYGKVNGSQDVERQAEISGLLSQVAKNNISGFNVYKKLYFDARVESSKSDAAKIAYRKYRLIDVTENDLKETKVIADNHLVPVASENNLISRLADKGVFRFVGESSVKVDTDVSNFTSDKYVLLHATEGSSDLQRVPCKKIITKDTSADGSNWPIFVLPYLRTDALAVLLMVVEKICEEIQPDYLDDDCKFEYLHKHNIVLHNGVMVNAKSWMNTGFGFVLEVKDYDFGKIVEEIDNQDKSISEAGNSKFKLIHIEKDKKLGNNIYDFWVSPKKV